MATSVDDRHAAAQRNAETTLPVDKSDWVVCFFSGEEVPRHEALQVRIGPGNKVWMLKEFTRSG